MGDANFIDHVRIYCCSGKGGPGAISFRREKNIPKGGPDGGDGGRGGHIIIRGNKNIWTLLPLRYRKHVRAENGKPGEGSLKTGADGKDVILDVPLGTVIKDANDEQIIGEILHDGETKVILQGGAGGLGNTHFKGPTNQTPRSTKPAGPAADGWFILELKILADVGLVGYPNAGKSTLVSTLSAAKPKIADYPFTTLVPTLGLVPYDASSSFVMADIPGIIENAHQGKGLGTRFLRHIERNAVLLFVIPADSNNIAREYKTLLNELKMYNPQLLDKKRLLAISKSDLLDNELMEAMKSELPDISYTFISSVTGFGLSELKHNIWNTLQQ